MTRVLGPAGAVALMLLAGCATGGISPSPTQPMPPTTTVAEVTTTTLSVEQAVTAFEECLDQSGIGVEAIPYDATGRPRLDLVMPEVDFSDPAHVQSFSACAEHLSSGALSLESEPELSELVLANLTAFANCVRAQGVADFPHPVEGFSGMGAPFPTDEIPYDDPDLSTATAACAERVSRPSD